MPDIGQSGFIPNVNPLQLSGIAARCLDPVPQLARKAVMNQRRTSIASLMKFVVVVALNLCIGRLVFRYEPWRLAAIGPIAVAIQVGLYSLVRSRGRPRPCSFWVGFETGGLLGLISLLYARVPESVVGAAWDDYAEFIDDLLSVNLGLSVLNRDPFDPALLIAVAVFASLPQMAMAVAGGLIGLTLGWSRQSRILTFKLIAIAVVPYTLFMLL
jgi:hypothetical protein